TWATRTMLPWMQRGRLLIADTRHAHVRRVDADGVIRTVVGTGFAWDLGDGGPALGASVVHVETIAVGPDTALYLGDAIGRIRRVDPNTGLIATIAGTGIPGYSGDGGPATQARIGTPTAICFDGAGNLYFADRAYHVIRRVTRQSGRIDTLIGNGQPGFTPDGERGTMALLDTPWGLEVDPDGSLYIADSGNNRVRRLRPGGRLETLLGAGALRLNEPHGLLRYAPHVLLVSDHFNNRVLAVAI
ncbi:MAG: serine/threonine protein kinase, partial [Oscillochloris sp.]|nr:serine/threonine protein kinase [Oscillochloris sp.]